MDIFLWVYKLKRLFFLYCFIVCVFNIVVGVFVDVKKYCLLFFGCGGIECCIDNVFYLGNRSVNFKLRLDCIDLEFYVEFKKIVKLLVLLSDSKIDIFYCCINFFRIYVKFW